ncbi:hypothetical protein DsansV1_C08g0080011 [Dioscorea sansibarensis]
MIKENTEARNQRKETGPQCGAVVIRRMLAVPSSDVVCPITWCTFGGTQSQCALGSVECAYAVYASPGMDSKPRLLAALESGNKFPFFFFFLMRNELKAKLLSFYNNNLLIYDFLLFFPFLKNT